MSCCLTPADPLPYTLHLAVGALPSNLCSSNSSSRKFGLPPPVSPAWGGCPFTAPVTTPAHLLLEREEVSLPLKQWITALSVLNSKGLSFSLGQ